MLPTYYRFKSHLLHLIDIFKEQVFLIYFACMFTISQFHNLILTLLLAAEVSSVVSDKETLLLLEGGYTLTIPEKMKSF